jgi:hypothetical protein
MNASELARAGGFDWDTLSAVDGLNLWAYHNGE